SQFHLRVSKTTTTTNLVFSYENISTSYKNDEPLQENLSEFQIWQYENQEFGYNLNIEDNLESCYNEPNNDSSDNLSYDDIEYDN
ncbi:31225_t:CDS:1, partial [Racocetra persica]